MPSNDTSQRAKKHRFTAKSEPLTRYVIEPSGCWVWQGAKTGGYAMYSVKGVEASAARLFYEHYKGAIGDNERLEFLCHNHACVNPDHLEPIADHRKTPRAPENGPVYKSPPLKIFDPNAKPGLCQCGCGQPTEIADKTQRHLGWILGQPKPFIYNHQRRLQAFDRIFTIGYTEDQETGCWIWQRGLNSDGYGITGRRGNTKGAHVWFYEFFIGPIPDGMHLDHLCGNPSCVCPWHTEPVTVAVNAQRGKNAKLTPDQVREILHLKGHMKAMDVAAKYGIHPGQVRAIWRGSTWSNIYEEIYGSVKGRYERRKYKEQIALLPEPPLEFPALG